MQVWNSLSRYGLSVLFQRPICTSVKVQCIKNVKTAAVKKSTRTKKELKLDELTETGGPVVVKNDPDSHQLQVLESFEKETKRTVKKSPKNSEKSLPEEVPIIVERNKSTLKKETSKKTKNDENEVLPTSPNESNSTCSTQLTKKNQNIQLSEPTCQPFLENNNVIIPFPMVVEKVVTEDESNEILTVSGTSYTHRQIPSVTQVLNETMPDSSAMLLAIWRKRKIAEVGEEGFKTFMREAKAVGKDLHTGIETFLRGVDYNQVHIEPRISGHWLSLKSILNSVRNVRAVETYVVHPDLKYKGFVDCVASHNGNLVVIDWKTSQRRKDTLEGTYDDPLQVAAYVGAINADENYPFKIENALLVVAYPTGMAADVLCLDRDQCQTYWKMWLKRLQEFHRLRNSSHKG